MNVRRHVFSLGVVAVFAFLAFGSLDTDTDTEETRSKAPAFALTASQLYQDYSANEIAADAKYKGRVVSVSGVVQDIGKDIMGQAYIVIAGNGLFGVQCMFTKGQEGEIARLSKGQYVTVKGEVSGKMGNVLMARCTLQ